MTQSLAMSPPATSRWSMDLLYHLAASLRLLDTAPQQQHQRRRTRTNLLQRRLSNPKLRSQLPPRQTHPALCPVKSHDATLPPGYVPTQHPTTQRTTSRFTSTTSSPIAVSTMSLANVNAETGILIQLARPARRTKSQLVSVPCVWKSRLTAPQATNASLTYEVRTRGKDQGQVRLGDTLDHLGAICFYRRDEPHFACTQFARLGARYDTCSRHQGWYRCQAERARAIWLFSSSRCLGCSREQGQRHREQQSYSGAPNSKV